MWTIFVPARLIRRLKAGNPDRRETSVYMRNLPRLQNSRPTTNCAWGISWATGDSSHHNFDLGRVERALALYGL